MGGQTGRGGNRREGEGVAAQHSGHHTRARAALAAAGAAVCLIAAPAALCTVSAPAAWAATRPDPYAFHPGDRRIDGTATTANAPVLADDTTYRDTLGPGGTRIYRLDLDAKSSAYVSAVAVPRLGTKVAYEDRISVSLQNADGDDCSSNQSDFGVTTDFPRPLAAYAYRATDPGSSLCAEAGTYYAVVQRTSAAGSSSDPWDLEIQHLTEPAPAESGPTHAPETWPSTAPQQFGDDPRPRAGGTSYNDAAALSKGVWSSTIKPGETLFYRIPVDWGQQFFGSVDLASAPPEDSSGTGGTASGAGPGFVPGALTMSLFNPARGFVESADPPLYDGKQKTTSLDALPPVAYQNRYSFRSGVRDMRFAGWYYVRVSLNPKVGAAFGDRGYGITLRLNVTGTQNSGPGYAGPAGPFAVPGGAGSSGAAGGGGHRGSGTTAAGGVVADRSTLRLMGIAGVGAGTVLVLGLGVWTLVARRRAFGRPPTA
jgi:hypothetical protein